MPQVGDDPGLHDLDGTFDLGLALGVIDPRGDDGRAEVIAHLPIDLV